LAWQPISCRFELFLTFRTMMLKIRQLLIFQLYFQRKLTDFSGCTGNDLATIQPPM
jgi:hypothetical protein